MDTSTFNYNHSVQLDKSRCTGCTRCLRRCPTEAIRIRDGQAQINDSICIDCGECVRVCPYNAKTAVCDDLSEIFEFKYKIALPSPAFYGQFDKLSPVENILQALLDYGFDDVYEVARATELVSGLTRQYLNASNVQKPLISSACPAVVRLIQHQFPELMDNISPILPPAELAARRARREALEKNPELKPEDIGVCFFSTCPAKATLLKERREKGLSSIDCVVSMNEVYFAVVGKLKKVAASGVRSRAGFRGVNWASSGGESAALGIENYLAADGIENVAHILEMISNDSFPDLEFAELNACHGGCVGGVMAVENCFIARARIQAIQSILPERAETEVITQGSVPEEFMNEVTLSVLRNSNWPTDMAQAFRNRARMQTILEGLPGIDCGACGSPSCLAFAKDIVMGRVSEDECVVIQRRKLKKLEQEAGYDG